MTCWFIFFKVRARGASIAGIPATWFVACTSTMIRFLFKNTLQISPYLIFTCVEHLFFIFYRMLFLGAKIDSYINIR